MDSERDISVEEIYWIVRSGETAAEMEGSRNGQREKSSSDAMISALKLASHCGQPGTLCSLRICQSVSVGFPEKGACKLG